MKLIDPDRYFAIAAHKEAIDDFLFRLPEVRAVGIGYKRVGERETDEMAIVVSVKKKGTFPPSHLIPPTLEGFPTDVIENEGIVSPILSPEEIRLDTESDEKRYDPLQPGCLIASAKPPYLHQGSLGPLARTLSGLQVYLGCWHVFCVVKDWRKTDINIYQPGTLEYAPNSIGLVQDGVIGAVPGPSIYVDAAYCGAPFRRSASARIPSIGPVTGTIPVHEVDKLLNLDVLKYGAKTLATQGRVVDVKYAWKHPTVGITFQNQILVRPMADLFNLPGDSGAPVVTGGSEGRIPYGRIVGIVMGLNEKDKTGVINPIWMILNALHLSIVPEADGKQE